jgi:hypothetical protein
MTTRKLLWGSLFSVLVACLCLWRTLNRSETTHTLPEEAATGAGLQPVGNTESSREPVLESAGTVVTVLDDLSDPVRGARVELISLEDGGRRAATTTSMGTLSVAPGDYVVWIRGDGLLDAIGVCDLATDQTLRVERGAQVTLTFKERGVPRSGIRAELLQQELGALQLDRRTMLRRCFDGASTAQELDSLLRAVGVQVPFGTVRDDTLLAQVSDTGGRVAWLEVPAGTYRWRVLSGEPIRFDPPYEEEQFDESPTGRLEINAVERDVSGPFEVVAGASLVLAPEVLRGGRAYGVVIAENDQPVEGARVTLLAVARSQSTSDGAMAPEAYARTEPHGTFVFENVSPGEKMAFAILDESNERSFWMTNRAAEFTLTEGEERDVGILSMAGATVDLSARLVGEDGRPLAVADVVEEKEPQTVLTLTNGIGAGRVFTAVFWMRIGNGDVYSLHGLTPMASVSLSSGRSGVEGLPWTLKRGFRDDGSYVTKRFDPYAEPRIVLDIPIQRVSSCEVHLALPAGILLQIDTSLHGSAIRQSDRRRFKVRVGSSADGFGGDLELPPGTYELLLSTSLPAEYPNFHARAEIEVPWEGRLELPLASAYVVSGVLLDVKGAPIRNGSSRVGLAGMREDESWSVIWTDDSGHFELSGVPPHCTLVFQGSADTIAVGAANVANVRVIRGP